MAARYTSDRAPALSRAHFQFQQASARAKMDERLVHRMNSSCAVVKKEASRLGYNRIETCSGGNQEGSNSFCDSSQDPWRRSPVRPPSLFSIVPAGRSRLAPTGAHRTARPPAVFEVVAGWLEPSLENQAPALTVARWIACQPAAWVMS